METPETEVIKDELSSDEEIANILKSANTGSSTTKEKKGKKREFEFKKKKKKDADSKPIEPTKEELEANKNRFLAEIEERNKEAEKRKKENMVSWGKD